jgi:hypothetical protein
MAQIFQGLLYQSSLNCAACQKLPLRKEGDPVAPQYGSSSTKKNGDPNTPLRMASCIHFDHVFAFEGVSSGD